jgi:hypothetical protein
MDDLAAAIDAALAGEIKRTALRHLADRGQQLLELRGLINTELAAVNARIETITGIPFDRIVAEWPAAP